MQRRDGPRGLNWGQPPSSRTSGGSRGLLRPEETASDSQRDGLRVAWSLHQCRGGPRVRACSLLGVSWLLETPVGFAAREGLKALVQVPLCLYQLFPRKAGGIGSCTYESQCQPALWCPGEEMKFFPVATVLGLSVVADAMNVRGVQRPSFSEVPVLQT